MNPATVRRCIACGDTYLAVGPVPVCPDRWNTGCDGPLIELATPTLPPPPAAGQGRLFD